MSALIAYDAEYIVALSQHLISLIEKFREKINHEKESEFIARYKQSFKNKFLTFFDIGTYPTKEEFKKMLKKEDADLNRYMFGSYPSQAYERTLEDCRNMITACKEAQMHNKSGRWTTVQLDSDQFAMLIRISKSLSNLNEENHEGD